MHIVRLACHCTTAALPAKRDADDGVVIRVERCVLATALFFDTNLYLWI